MKEWAIYLLIFFKRSGSLGTCYSAHPVLCGFFKETPQMLHTLQLLAGGIPVSVFLSVCNSLLIRNCWNTACCSPPPNCSSAQLCALPDQGNSPLGGPDLPAEPQEPQSSISSVLSSWESAVVLLHREHFSALALQGGFSGMYIFLENHVLVLWVAFKRSWQLEVNHKRDNKKAFHVEAVYCIG